MGSRGHVASPTGWIRVQACHGQHIALLAVSQSEAPVPTFVFEAKALIQRNGSGIVGKYGQFGAQNVPPLSCLARQALRIICTNAAQIG